MSESVYTVAGMTCGKCVDAVTTEVGRVAGVRRVEVDLGSGEVRVTSDRPLTADEVSAAVDEAGYELVTR
ncbi:heavy-metal-associated domain-containing protein [Amycolatopsis saalfeldensis]|uniref:Copper ion binding protein n=1 Tax=Amycolatopsis saalfeldensis TaxID=394193 RepID=A0A1H8YMD3_9PSEU|nr:heavy metal-associated domain-containing protein [Amycolatopsis saalfeldensis]SEP53345.1 copper ion binding protein [Amycolatopsis saalfeldensis]